MQLFTGAATASAIASESLDKTMKFHPVADLFPMMDAEEREAFCLDIATNGLQEDIVTALDTDDGELKIADGRHRYEACQKVGIEPRYREWEWQGDLTTLEGRTRYNDALLDTVVSLNLKRRHLTESQRAMIAAGLATMRQGERTDLPQNCGRLSQAAAARLLNVSERSVTDAKRVIEDGVPELADMVKTGDLKVSQAVRVAKMGPEKQKEIIRRGRKAAKKIIQQHKIQSLRQTAKGYGTCLYCNPEIGFDDDHVSAFVQRLEQRSKEAKRDGRAQRNYGPFFEGIALEIADMRRGETALPLQEKILAIIDASDQRDDLRHQCIEKTDLHRMLGEPWPIFNDVIAVMIDLNLVEAIKQGGKTDGARGARKILYRRSTKAASELTYEIEDDGDFPEKDVYLDRW